EPGGNVLIDGQRRDAPTVFVVDPAAARIVATIPLPVRAGQYQDPAAPTADEPWRQIAPGLAWDGPRSRLFVAAAESDRIFRAARPARHRHRRHGRARADGGGVDGTVARAGWVVAPVWQRAMGLHSRGLRDKERVDAPSRGRRKC